MSRLWLLLILPFAACASLEKPPAAQKPPTALYKVETVRVEQGIASWYRDRRTASGERFDVNAMAAAHRKLPFGTKVRVTDLKTNKQVIVRINDRGPYIRGRIIDLTVGAAQKLGMYSRGIARVKVEVLREIPIMRHPNLHEKPAAPRREVSLEDAVREAPRTVSR